MFGQGVLGQGAIPDMVLEGADGGAGGQSQRLGGLAGQVGEQAPTVDLQQAESGRTATAVSKPLQVNGEGWFQSLDLFGCHSHLR